MERLNLGGAPLCAGARVGPYEVVGHLATGGMGEVYVARRRGDAGIEGTVVLKVMLSHLARDEHSARMFVDEARIVSGLNHPNIVRVHDFGHEAGVLFLALEYLHGQSAATCLRRCVYSKTDLPPEVAAHIMYEAASGLAHAHAATGSDGKSLHLVHRDITPDNLFVTYEGVSKILDFGVAKVRGRLATTQEGEFKGKVGYMAPEVVRGEEIDARSDLFSLGVVFFELLTLKRLFGSDNPATTLHLLLNEPVPAVRQVRSAVDPELARICEFLLVREPDRRVQDAEMVCGWLSNWLRAHRVASADVSSWIQTAFRESYEASRAMNVSLHDTGEINVRDFREFKHLISEEVGDVLVPDLTKTERWSGEGAARELGEEQPSTQAAPYFQSLADQDEVWADGRSRSRVSWTSIIGLVLFLAMAGGAFGTYQAGLWSFSKSGDAPRAGESVGAYVIEQRIQTHAAAASYRVRDREGSQVKLLRLSAPMSAEEGMRTVEALRSSFGPMKTLALPLILAPSGVGVHEGRVFEVYPWKDVRPLDTVLASSLEAAEARRIVREIVTILLAAEQVELVHGDLRPSQVLLDREGGVYLIGFRMGLSAPATQGGAPDVYRAPELRMDRQGNALSDQFGLAMIADQVLRRFDPRTHVRVAKILAKATSAEPERRYDSHANFARALERAMGERKRRRRRR